MTYSPSSVQTVSSLLRLVVIIIITMFTQDFTITGAFSIAPYLLFREGHHRPRQKKTLLFSSPQQNDFAATSKTNECDHDNDDSTTQNIRWSTHNTFTANKTTLPPSTPVVPPYRKGSLMAATLEQGRVPYGEDSRKYRRTIFSHIDWVEHRNDERRILTNLKGIFFSGIVRQLQSEVLLVTAVAATVVLWNDVLAVALSSSSSTYQIPLLTLPSLPFTLSSPALGLLLVFRTNASYARWLEARNTWARIVSNSRNIIRMTATFMDLSNLEHQMALKQLGFDVWMFCRTLMNQLLGPQDENDYLGEVSDFLSSSSSTTSSSSSLNDSDAIVQAPDRVMAALARVSMSLDRVPIDEKRRVEIDKSIVLLGDCTAICEKIFTSPVPLVYTRHTARFLSLWMLLLPTALYHTFADDAAAAAAAAATTTPTTPSINMLLLPPLPPGFGLIPAAAIVSLFLFGIAELAVQLEEPFSILPLQSFCDSVKSSTTVISDYCIRQSHRHHEQEQPEPQP